MNARKLSFQEVWDSSTVFFVDESLETAIDQRANELLVLSQHPRLLHSDEKTEADLLVFLADDINGLDVIVRDVGLSEEKFMRIVSLLRKLGRIPGGFDVEWSIEKVKREMMRDSSLAFIIISLLVDGKRDEGLRPYIPRYYQDRLNYRELGAISPAAREMRYKDSLSGTYAAGKGRLTEAKVARKLAYIKQTYGISYEKGRSRFINVDMDFAIPSLEDPWVIVMSSFQETTGSGQTTKTRDMQAAYMLINQSNSRYRENRVFVNFIDGGGWLARKSDLRRLVEECHYFLNLQHLDMLEAIIQSHVPQNYFQNR